MFETSEKKENTQHKMGLVKLAKYIYDSRSNINIMLNINVMFYCIEVIFCRMKSKRGVVLDYIRVYVCKCKCI